LLPGAGFNRRRIKALERVRACSPSKVQGSSGDPTGVATGKAASREVRCSSECCKRSARGLLVPRSRLAPRRFRRTPHGFYRPPSPAHLRERVHPLVSSTPLQSPPASCLPRASRRGAPSRGLAFPLRDINRQRRYDEIPLSSPSVLGVSHALDGFIRCRPCGFVSPRSRVQGSPTRSSSRTAGPARHRPVPSRRWRRSAAPVARCATFPRPALRALICTRAPVPLLR